MLRRFTQWVKKHPIPIDEKSKKKRAIKEWLSELGFDWCDFENLMFWKDPRISLFVYVIFTLCCWKFIIFKFQRLAVIIILGISPTVIGDIRVQMKKYLTERIGCEILEENKTLGFDVDDVCEVAAEMWIILDDHYIYLMSLKRDQNPFLIFILVGYGSMLILFLKYVPVVGIIFVFGTIAYFYPITNYLGLTDKLAEKIDKFTRPIAAHWFHSQTKRRRDVSLHSPKKRRQVPIHREDIEHEEFVPESSQYTEKMLTSATSCNDSMNDSHDEFELRRNLRHMDDDDSSDYDESAFLPSYIAGPSQAMPSLSQFDSLMEPLEDEFHGGLDFNNTGATSYSDFGIPKDYRQGQEHFEGDDTDEDVDEIPVEQTDGSKYASIARYSNPKLATASIVTGSNDVEGQDFEFLDRTELKDVTDEEINEQITAPQTNSITKGVSNYLGY